MGDEILPWCECMVQRIQGGAATSSWSSCPCAAAPLFMGFTLLKEKKGGGGRSNNKVKMIRMSEGGKGKGMDKYLKSN